MESYFVRPDVKILPIFNGETITVKAKLNTGEHRALLATMSIVTKETGELTPNYMQIGIAKVVAYLVDWSLKDENGKPVSLREQNGNLKSRDEVTLIVDTLDLVRFGDIREAVEKHIAALEAAEAIEKNGQGGASASPAISALPDAATGVTNGSPS